MEQIETYVFFDLAVREHGRTRIAEVGMVSLKRSHILISPKKNKLLPRVVNKLNVYINEDRKNTEATQYAGLDEDQLHQTIEQLIEEFLGCQKHHLCLIVRNENFAILGHKFEGVKLFGLNNYFPTDVMQGTEKSCLKMAELVVRDKDIFISRIDQDHATFSQKLPMTP